MKRILALVVLMGLMTVPAIANDIADTIENADSLVKFDAPYLAQVTTNNYLGVEAYKDTDSFNADLDNTTFLVKWTYLGTLWGKSPWASSKTE